MKPIVIAPFTRKEYDFFVRVLVSCKNDEQFLIGQDWLEQILIKKYECGPTEANHIVEDILCSVVLEKLGDKID